MVAGDHPEAVALFARQQAELTERYGEPDDGDFDPAGLLGVVVLHAGDVPVACVALRDVSGAPDGRGGVHPLATGEAKRLFVAPEHRGHGYARAVMRAVHDQAASVGLGRLVLETGTLQPESIDLYLSLGYLPIERYGHYADQPESRCFALDLARLGADGAAAAVRRSDTRGVGSAVGLGAGRDVEVRPSTWDDPDAARLRREMHESSSAVLYPEVFGALDAAGYAALDARLGADVVASFLAVAADGEAVGCAFLRRPDAGAPEGSLEVKKVFVRESARGAGAARALMAAAEDAARRLGASTAVLETGIRQPAAITLYRSLGYRVVLPFPPFDGPNPIALCFGKPLEPRRPGR
ncbi:GNAT family N-acetyltransferase [Cellulosimicrobium arenosum]|uniref:GNAT family N-acetyltransferase n=1 Tax=Cellulosimicrobium arenosum TaxID=2708133 RepID=A0A927G978_9MICO|nr:GNAT family N-acetyltransferase [Cellulosimicrobium arenosum]